MLTWKTKNMATAAWSAEVLFDGTKLATRAASTMRHAIQPYTPPAMNLFRGKRSMRNMPMTLVPRANVNHAAGYKSCLTVPKPSCA